MTLVVKKTVPANGSVTFRVSYSFSTAAYLAATAALVDLIGDRIDDDDGATALAAALRALRGPSAAPAATPSTAAPSQS